MIQLIPLVVIEPILVVTKVAQSPRSIECADYAQFGVIMRSQKSQQYEA